MENTPKEEIKRTKENQIDKSAFQLANIGEPSPDAVPPSNQCTGCMDLNLICEAPGETSTAVNQLRQ